MSKTLFAPKLVCDPKKILSYPLGQISHLDEIDEAIVDLFGTFKRELFVFRNTGKTQQEIENEDSLLYVEFHECLSVFDRLAGMKLALESIEADTWWYELGLSKENPVSTLPPVEIAYKFGGINGLRLILSRFSLMHRNLTEQRRMTFLPNRECFYSKYCNSSVSQMVGAILRHPIRNIFEVGICEENLFDKDYKNACPLITERIGLEGRNYILRFWGIFVKNQMAAKDNLIEERFNRIRDLKV